MERSNAVMKRAMLSPAVLGFLEKDRIATLNIVGVLRNEPGMEILVDDEESPRGVLVKGPWFWYVHTEDDAFLEAMFLELEQNEGFYRFSGVWRPIAEKIKARFPLVWDAPCDLYCLPSENYQPELARHQARSVAIQDAELIDQHYAYRNSGSLEKIRNCITDRNSSAIYVDGELVCWLLVHEDNSLGIMYTLEHHRRKGYALDVTTDLVRKQLAEGKTPFLQIRDDNSMSPGLAGKCGFVRHGSCEWFGIVAGTPHELIEGGIEFRRRILEPMAKVGRVQPEQELVCLYRFLYPLKSEPIENNQVVEAGDDEEWLEFSSRYFDAEMLRTSLNSLRKDYRLLCERRDGAISAVAALLVDEDDGFELLWLTCNEERFLQNVLEKAKAMNLGTVFVHVPDGERGIFERLGFREVYNEK